MMGKYEMIGCYGYFAEIDENNNLKDIDAKEIQLYLNSGQVIEYTDLPRIFTAKGVYRYIKENIREIEACHINKIKVVFGDGTFDYMNIWMDKPEFQREFDNARV